MNYQETIEYLFSVLPMFSKTGASAYKADLTNTLKLCNYLNNPQQHFKAVHVAGTNGKGSTSHSLAAVLQTEGYKTGLYTSPHLKDFRERIKVNGVMCSKDFVVAFTKKIQPLIDEIQPSFFEITVAMAFEYFAEQEVDIAIIETGLGGRLDSTNIIHPILSVITNIGYDHMNILGNSLEEIAFEKAGIIKHNTPVIIGEYLAQTKAIFIKKAKEENAPIVFAQEKRQVKKFEWNNDLLHVEMTHTNEKYELDLSGVYQTKNLITILESLSALKHIGCKITEQHIKDGLKNVKKLTGLYGRWDIIRKNPTVVLDVGHNEDGIKQIIHQLALSAFEKLHIIIGMVKDKEIEKVLSLLPQSANYYFTKAQIPRALDEIELMGKASDFGLTGDHYSNVNQALEAALLRSGISDLILVCGSVFLVGEVECII